MVNLSAHKAWYHILINTVLILFCLSAIAAPGNPKWAFHTAKDIISSPVLGPDGTIYVGSSDSNLYAINPDGSLKWVFDTGVYGVFSSPAVGTDGTIYVGSESKKLHAINPDGTEKWVFSSLFEIGSSPALGPDGTIYISTGQKFYAINPDGTKKWETTIDFFCTDMMLGSSAAIAKDGTIYVGSCSGSSGGLYAVSPGGVQKWKFTTPNNVQASPAIGSDGTIYIGSSAGSDWGNFYAINPDGSLKWSVPANDIRGSAAIGADGTIYVGTFSSFAAINQDGTVKWDFPTSWYVVSSPAIGNDGTLYVTGWSDRLFAFSPDGVQKWVYVPEDSYVGSISSPVIGKDGTVYVGLGSTLYAIESDSGGLGHVQWPMFRHDTRHSGTLDPHDHFAVSDIAPAQQAGVSIPVTLTAQDSSNNSIVTYNRPTRIRGFTGSKEDYFSEDFEDGDYDGWLDGAIPFQRRITSDTSAAGNHALSLKGPFSGNPHRNGVAFSFKQPRAPEDISFYVRSGSTDLADGYFVIGPNYHCPIWFYMNSNGKFYANFEIDVSYQANVWYKIQFVIDWLNYSFDLYINDNLVYPGIAFRNSESSFSTIYLYNHQDSQAWWDEIVFNASSRSPVSMAPLEVTNFSSGIWSGDVEVTGAVTDMFLVADDGAGHLGMSNNFSVTNTGLDTDNDGLSDALENGTCSLFNDGDSDDDGISDGAEDSNANGMMDVGETDPCNIDSDSDGIQDGTELGFTLIDINSDTDPATFIPDQDPSTTTKPLIQDTDGDGSIDGKEDSNHNGIVDAGETDPLDKNSNSSQFPWTMFLPAISGAK